MKIKMVSKEDLISALQFYADRRHYITVTKGYDTYLTMPYRDPNGSIHVYSGLTDNKPTLEVIDTGEVARKVLEQL